MNASEIIKSIEAEQLKAEVPEFRVGDTVKVYGKIKEGNRERIQVFEGVVIKPPYLPYIGSRLGRRTSYEDREQYTVVANGSRYLLRYAYLDGTHRHHPACALLARVRQAREV